MRRIATFYSHFGAVRFKRLCESKGIPARMMPVPRDLSSSCGTCVLYDGDEPCPSGTWPEEVEQAVTLLPDGYQVIYRAEGS